MSLKGLSYIKRVKEVNEIYDKYIKLGLSNREIWRRHVYPRFCISEKTFYNYLSASSDDEVIQKQLMIQDTLFD